MDSQVCEIELLYRWITAYIDVCVSGDSKSTFQKLKEGEKPEKPTAR